MSEADQLNIAEIPYPSGQVQFRCARKLNGSGDAWIRHGLFASYHENGTVSSEGEYVEGKEEGRWRTFHSNGQLASEGQYVAGQQEGVWRFFHSDGTEEAPESYREGKAS